MKEASRFASSLSHSGIVRNQRRAAATGDASLRANGCGAPSRGRVSVLVLSLTAVVALAFLASPASASKEVLNYFGTTDFNSNASNAVGAEFSNPRDTAVNSTGNGPADAGDIYVADDEYNRIQRFDSEGNFISAWGANVLTDPANEVQTLTVSATAGTYTLSFGGATTGNIAFNATAGAVQTALRALPSVNGANLTVSGTAPYTITFNNSFSATNVPQLAVDDALLTGTVALATTTQGSGQYEVCVVAANCRGGSATGGANAGNNAKNGSLDNPQSVAVDADTGNVYVSDRDNRRINEYAGDGTFVRSFGFGVDATEAGEGYEVCPASNRCRTGIAGEGAGQLGATTTGGTLGIAVSPPDGEAAVGKVFLADSQNRRVNTYEARRHLTVELRLRRELRHYAAAQNRRRQPRHRLCLGLQRRRRDRPLRLRKRQRGRRRLPRIDRRPAPARRTGGDSDLRPGGRSRLGRSGCRRGHPLRPPRSQLGQHGRAAVWPDQRPRS